MCQQSIYKNDIVNLYVGDVYAVNSSEIDLINDRWKTAQYERDVGQQGS